jgi:hypothetical protein
MSTYYVPNPPIKFNKIDNIRKEVAKLFELRGPHEAKDETEDQICFTDGDNFLWATQTKKGLTTFARYGGNNVESLLETLEEIAEVVFVSEHDEEWEELRDKHYSDAYTVISFDE